MRSTSSCSTDTRTSTPKPFVRPSLPLATLPLTPSCSGLVDAGLIDLKPLVTHRFTLEDAVEAFEIETAVDISRGGTSTLALPPTERATLT